MISRLGVMRAMVIAGTLSGAIPCPVRSYPEPPVFSPAFQETQPEQTVEQDSRELDALAAARDMVRDKPDSARAATALGVALVRVGNNDAALKEFERVVRLAPGDSQVWYMKGLLEARKNMWAPAAHDFRQAVNSNPASADALIELGDMLRRTGDFEGAEIELGRALRLQPGNALAIYDLGLVHFAQGRMEVAEGEFKSALELQPEFLESLESLGDALLFRHAWAAAASAYRRVLARRPDSLEVANGLAAVMSHLGDPSQAAMARQYALKLAHQKLMRQRAELSSARAKSLSESGKIEAALVAYSQALDEDPGYPEAHYDLGCLLWKQRKDGDAVREYEAALQLRPRYPEALNKLGEAHLDLGQTRRAVQEFQSAVAIRVGHAPAHLNLGRAYLKTGQSDTAQNEFQAAITLDPTLAEAHIELGLLFARTDGKVSSRARVELLEGLRLDFGLRSMIPSSLAAQLQ